MRTDIWDHSAWRKESSSETLLQPLNMQRGLIRKMKEVVFTKAWSYRTRGNSFKPKDVRFRLDMKRKYFMMRLVRHCNTFSRNAVDVLQQEVLKVRSDEALSKVNVVEYVSDCCTGVDLRWSLSTQNILWFYDPMSFYFYLCTSFHCCWRSLVDFICLQQAYVSQSSLNSTVTSVSLHRCSYTHFFSTIIMLGIIKIKENPSTSFFYYYYLEADFPCLSLNPGIFTQCQKMQSGSTTAKSI